MIKIRLSRAGRPHRPVYSVLAIDSKKAQNGTCLENLGTYNPQAVEPIKGINVEAISAWMNKGAILTETVKSLLKKNKISFKK